MRRNTSRRRRQNVSHRLQQLAIAPPTSVTELRRWLATRLQVEGPARLSNLVITKTADLDHASFLNLALGRVSWPAAQQDFRLDGMTYQDIAVSMDDGGAYNWMAMLDLANKSAYSVQTYANVESYLKQRGYSDLADMVFTAGQ